MLKQQVSYLKENVLPTLAKSGVTIEPYAALTQKIKNMLDKYFRNNLFPDSDAAVGRFEPSVPVYLKSEFESRTFYRAGPQLDAQPIYSTFSGKSGLFA